MRPDSLLLTAAQRRKERLRQQIITVATELYDLNGGADGGFEATTVESIAARADISVRTFFRYFDSKVDVIFLDKQRALEDLTALTTSRLAHEPPMAAVIGASLEQVAWFMGDDVNRARLRRSLIAPEFADRLAALREHERRILADRVRQVLPDGATRDIQAEVITTTIRNIIHLALKEWAFKHCELLPTILSACEMLPGVSADIVALATSMPALENAQDR